MSNAPTDVTLAANITRFSMDCVVADMDNDPKLKLHEVLTGLRRGGGTLGGILADDDTPIHALIDHTAVRAEGRQIIAKVVFHIPPGKTWEKLRARLDIDPEHPVGKLASTPTPVVAPPTPAPPMKGLPSAAAFGTPGIIMGPPPTKPETPATDAVDTESPQS